MSLTAFTCDLQPTCFHVLVLWSFSGEKGSWTLSFSFMKSLRGIISMHWSLVHSERAQKAGKVNKGRSGSNNVPLAG